MDDLTSREKAWLRSLEVPLLPNCGSGFPPVAETSACIAAARQAITLSAGLLAETTPAQSAWTRYLGS